MTTFKIIPDTTQSFKIAVISGDVSLVAATSPIIYDQASKTISFDQAAENAVNDTRYFKRSGDTIDAGTIV
jgi:hypothetical protein